MVMQQSAEGIRVVMRQRPRIQREMPMAAHYVASWSCARFAVKRPIAGVFLFGLKRFYDFVRGRGDAPRASQGFSRELRLDVRPAILREESPEGAGTGVGSFLPSPAKPQRWPSSHSWRVPSCWETSFESPQSWQAERISRRDPERSSVRVNAAGDAIFDADANCFLSSSWVDAAEDVIMRRDKEKTKNNCGSACREG
jgi:hypothetical protein